MPYELGVTAARAVAVYFIMLLVMRVLGKRAVGNFSAFDLLVALMLGDVIGDIIFQDVSFSKGLMAILPIAALEYGNTWLSYLGLDRLLEGVPSIVVRDGECHPSGMRKERMNRNDIMGALREHGVTDIRQIKLAVVEADGHISVIQHDWSMPLEKADFLGDAAAERAQAMGRHNAVDDVSSTSPRYVPAQ